MFIFMLTLGEKGNGDGGTDESLPNIWLFFEFMMGDDSRNPGDPPYGNGECRGALSKSCVFDIGLGLGPHAKSEMFLVNGDCGSEKDGALLIGESAYLGLLPGLCFNAAFKGFLEVPGASLGLFGSAASKFMFFARTGSLDRRFSNGLGGNV